MGAPGVTILPQEPSKVYVRLEAPALRAVRDDDDALDVQPSQDRPDGWRVTARQRTNVGEPLTFRASASASFASIAPTIAFDCFPLAMASTSHPQHGHRIAYT